MMANPIDAIQRRIAKNGCIIIRPDRRKATRDGIDREPATAAPQRITDLVDTKYSCGLCCIVIVVFPITIDVGIEEEEVNSGLYSAMGGKNSGIAGT
jgi:hypothetical protein